MANKLNNALVAKATNFQSELGERVYVCYYANTRVTGKARPVRAQWCKGNGENAEANAIALASEIAKSCKSNEFVELVKVEKFKSAEGAYRAVQTPVAVYTATKTTIAAEAVKAHEAAKAASKQSKATPKTAAKAAAKPAVARKSDAKASDALEARIANIESAVEKVSLMFEYLMLTLGGGNSEAASAASEPEGKN